MFHIFVCCDDNDVKYAAVLLTSIIQNVDTSKSFKELFNASNSLLENYKKLNFDELSEEEQKEGFVFHILTDKLSNETKANLSTLERNLNEKYPCKIQVHFVDNTEFEHLAKFGRNHITYYKLKIPALAPKNARTCLFLDADTLAFGDLRSLFMLDLEGYFMGVVKDMHHTHFNAGVMFFNLALWNANNINTQVDILIRRGGALA